MLYNLHFFSSKCRLFHNATLFRFCITHILNTGVLKFEEKKIRRQKVKQFYYMKELPSTDGEIKHSQSARGYRDISMQKISQGTKFVVI
jgi:hypothetical protein